MVKRTFNKLGLVALTLLPLASSLKSQDQQPTEKPKTEVSFNFTKGNAGACGLATGDFDGDGFMDIAVGDLSGVYIYKGQKERKISFDYFTELRGIETDKVDAGACGLASGDFDRDGLSDLLVGDTNSLRLFYNRNGKFDKGKIIVSADNLYLDNYRKNLGGACGLETIDIDKDGKPEIIFGNIAYSTGIYDLTDRNTLKLRSILPDITNYIPEKDGLSGVTSIRLGNEDPKILVGSRDGFKLFENKDGKYVNLDSPLGRLDPPLQSCGLATGDFNRDGLDDLLLGEARGVYVYLQNKKQEFSKPIKIRFYK